MCVCVYCFIQTHFYDISMRKYPLQGVFMLFCTNTHYGDILSGKHPLWGHLWAISYKPYHGILSGKYPLWGACVLFLTRRLFGDIRACVYVIITYHDTRHKIKTVIFTVEQHKLFLWLGELSCRFLCKTFSWNNWIYIWFITIMTSSSPKIFQ